MEANVSTVEIEGRTIAYECPVPVGRVQGRPYLFVHGASFNRHVWDAQMAYFARTDTPVCLDLAGHGQSSSPICETIEDHQAIVKALADSIGLSGFILAGHSMGGAIAQAYVAWHPEDVQALVLVSTSPKFEIPEEAIAEWGQDPAKYREQELDIILAPMTGQDVRQELLSMRDGNAPDVQYADLIACSRWNNASGFAVIRHPTLLITSEYDSLLETNRDMHRQLPQSKLMVLKRSGHMISVEEPEEVNRAIETFVKDLP
jgi:3-oxoadipate enol-lactonase